MTDRDIPTMVARSDIYNVVADWGRRPETAESLAGRWLALIARLEVLDPVFARWSHWEEGSGFVPFDPRLEAQGARVIAHTERTRTGRLVPEAGSRIWNMTDPHPRSRRFNISMFAGNDNAYHDNNVVFKTDSCAVPDPRVLTYRIFRGALLAIAETFAVTQAYAYPSDLFDLWSKGPAHKFDLPLAWISYIPARFGPLVTPPPNVIVEHRPDGGLLMAATDETFVTANPAHLAAARTIHAALGPFNAVAWTPETGK